jgi:flagellar operon protein
LLFGVWTGNEGNENALHFLRRMRMAPVQVNKTIPGVGVPSTGQAQPKSIGLLRQAQDAQDGFAGALQAEVLKQGGVKFSAHAAKRLAERNVELSANDQARLETAVDRIESKGADKSLVLMDNLALLVSAKNRVVITALDAASAKDGVFTNIDSAVII